MRQILHWSTISPYAANNYSVGILRAVPSGRWPMFRARLTDNPGCLGAPGLAFETWDELIPFRSRTHRSLNVRQRPEIRRIPPVKTDPGPSPMQFENPQASPSGPSPSRNPHRRSRNPAQAGQNRKSWANQPRCGPEEAQIDVENTQNSPNHLRSIDNHTHFAAKFL